MREEHKLDIAYREPTEREAILGKIFEMIDESRLERDLVKTERHRGWNEALEYVRNRILYQGL